MIKIIIIRSFRLNVEDGWLLRTASLLQLQVIGQRTDAYHGLYLRCHYRRQLFVFDAYFGICPFVLYIQIAELFGLAVE